MAANKRPTRDILIGRIEFQQTSASPADLQDAWDRLLAIDAAVTDLKAALARIDVALRRS